MAASNGLGRTRFAGAVDSSLADTPAGHSVADDSRRAATSGNDIMATADGARTWQRVRSHRAAGRRCRGAIGLVRARHRASARGCIPVAHAVGNRPDCRRNHRLHGPAGSLAANLRFRAARDALSWL